MARTDLSLPALSQLQFGSTRWERNGVIRFDLEGELDRASSPSFGDELASVQSKGWRAILLDASNLSFMDTSGLHVLMDADAKADAGSAWVAIARCTPSVRKVFSLAGQARLLGRQRIAIAMAFAAEGWDDDWVPMVWTTEVAMTA